MLTRDQFTDYLRDALDHLYDPDHLSRSPLVYLFELTERVDTSFALQNILIETIETLEPEVTAPAQSRAWRLYDLLLCRYVQQTNVQEVADQLSISRRHLRREQNAALAMLAQRLWKQFDIDAKALDWLYGDTTEIMSGFMEASPEVDEELSWLKHLPAKQATDLHEILPDVFELVDSLAARNRVNLKLVRGTSRAHSAAHQVAVRQLLLSLFTFAIEHIPDGSLHVKTEPSQWDIRILVLGQPSASGLRAASSDESTGLTVARKIADLIGGRLTVAIGEKTFAATVTLPALERLPVLAIDDNSDTLALFQRYTEGTRYCLLGEQNPGNAVHVAEQASPKIIVLDVMMPNVDGWEVLGRLRENPSTTHIPIIVCTILAMEGLAISLGADACIRKPLTQAAFLAALDRQLEPQALESR